MAIQCSKCGGPKDGSHKSWCKACFAAYMRARYVPKPRAQPSAEQIVDNARARGRRHYAKHRERIRHDYAVNKDAICEHRNKLRAALDDETRQARARDAKQRRRAKTAGVRFVEYVDPLVVLEQADGICGICYDDVDPFAFDVDHVIPLSRGGEHSYANTQASHPTCNRRKRDKVVF